MGRYNDFIKGAGNLVNELADSIDEGINIGRSMFSGEMLVNQAENEFKSCRKKCCLVMFLLFIVCGLIIYFHLRG